MFNIKGKLQPDYNEKDIVNLIYKNSTLKERNLLKKGFQWRFAKLSLDARRNFKLQYHALIEVYPAGENPPEFAASWHFSINGDRINRTLAPVVVGLGPSGLFAAYYLALAGLNPVIIEQGKDVIARQIDVNEFWQNSQLNMYSNVQFGEGGAGTFSDGKLHTGIKSPWIKNVFNTLVEFGAPEEILYSGHPHIGTDKLPAILTKMRKKIIELGGKFHFNSRFDQLIIENNEIAGIEYTYLPTMEKNILSTRHLILATGHSSRETYYNLAKQEIELETKATAIGVRIEHPQQFIDLAQYNEDYFAYPNLLPPAPYKLTAQAPNGRSVYSFCMCPGGKVIAGASDYSQVVTNGMSEFARDGYYANSALLVNITADDYDKFFHDEKNLFHDEIPRLQKWRSRVEKYPVLAGIYMQEQLEYRAFVLGGGNYSAPMMKVGDFMQGGEMVTKVPISKPDFDMLKTLNNIEKAEEYTYKPGIKNIDLRTMFPKYVITTLQYGIISFGRKLKFFDNPDAVLYAVESRSSAPVRIVRGENRQASINGLYPVGEGAGYAGGITSAAVDGLKTVAHILDQL